MKKILKFALFIFVFGFMISLFSVLSKSFSSKKKYEHHIKIDYVLNTGGNPSKLYSGILDFTCYSNSKDEINSYSKLNNYFKSFCTSNYLNSCYIKCSPYSSYYWEYDGYDSLYSPTLISDYNYIYYSLSDDNIYHLDDSYNSYSILKENGTIIDSNYIYHIFISDRVFLNNKPLNYEHSIYIEYDFNEIVEYFNGESYINIERDIDYFNYSFDFISNSNIEINNYSSLKKELYNYCIYNNVSSCYFKSRTTFVNCYISYSLDDDNIYYLDDNFEVLKNIDDYYIDDISSIEDGYSYEFNVLDVVS